MGQSLPRLFFIRILNSRTLYSWQIAVKVSMGVNGISAKAPLIIQFDKIVVKIEPRSRAESVGLCQKVVVSTQNVSMG